jgi:hypothetical protein
MTNQRFIPKFGMKLLLTHTVQQDFYQALVSNFESLVAGYSLSIYSDEQHITYAATEEFT